MDHKIKVPMVRGLTRRIGSREGWLFDGHSEGYAAMTAAIERAIKAVQSDFTATAISLKVIEMFTKADADWQAEKAQTATVGHVFELELGGQSFLLGDERVLARVRA